jgi:hypothetical protein
MKANELMVDDWVLWKGKPVQVASVSGVKYSFGQIDVTLAHCNDKKILETHDIKSIQPIPLTPEILEKNGFTKGGMFAKTYYLAVEDFEISVYFAHVNTQLIIEKRNGKEIINLLNVEYLHILQHALKLCGIDKSIEL